MRKTTLFFIVLGIFSFFFADIEILTLEPWTELGRILKGVITPDVSVLFYLKEAVLNTVVFAFTGVSIAIVSGSLFAPFYKYKLVRIVLTIFRSIHEIFWAFIFLPVFGLNSVTGIFAIAVPYSAIFAKRFYEIYQSTDLRACNELPGNSSPVLRFLFGALPLLYEEMREFSSYRVECAIRSSAVLGFIGLPTLGFHLESFFNEGKYSQAFAILLLFYVIIGTKKYWLRRKLVPVYFFTSIIFVWGNTHVVWANIVRFFTYDIIPWPMRRDGFINNTKQILWRPSETIDWFYTLLRGEVLPGARDTLILTQITFLLSGVFAILFIGLVVRNINKPLIRKFIRILLLVFRSTPEYITAYVAIQLWGPSMMPGIVALVLHNSAVVTILTIRNADSLVLPLDVARGKINCFFFHILPQIYNSFLGNLFYRWEVMVRESSILGVLGIYTLGFYIDSAISDDKMDKVIFLIMCMSIINIVIDSVSNKVRSVILE